ncbi:MAG: helix-turn-helix domain-containing protein [Gracilibacteraceae bacterium]|jgi:transcriptional regulator with XRE-family HTH domain|nr:helix-turn-helix domain-containing protein [Gracilibacteraceae bacterium]
MGEQKASFGAFLKEKRRQREITLRAMAEMAGVSAGYYCDFESGRRNPPDKEILDKMLNVLLVPDEERRMFYDLAGKARAEAPPDLPEYINAYEEVRVALRLAKDKGDAGIQVWRRVIHMLEED